MKIFGPIFLVQAVIGLALCAVSFLTATTIAVDGLLALRNKQVVNLARVKAAIFFATVFGVCCGLTYSFQDCEIAWIQYVVFILL